MYRYRARQLVVKLLVAQPAAGNDNMGVMAELWLPSPTERGEASDLREQGEYRDCPGVTTQNDRN